MTDSVYDGTTTSAVITSRESAATVHQRLATAGWTVAELSGVVDEGGFHAGIAAVLGFPGHYGANLDALWDCLTDLRAPTALVWRDWATLAVDHPRQWARVLGVLRDRISDPPTGSPAFAVVLVGND